MDTTENLWEKYKKEMLGAWTKQEMQEHKKSIGKTKKELHKLVNKYKPYDYGYMLDILVVILDNMAEYYNKGVNVWQAEETRVPAAESLTKATEMLKHCLNEGTDQEFEETFAYIGKHIFTWWD